MSVGQTHERLLGTDNAARLVSEFLHHAVQRLVPGDSGSGIGCTLQREQMLLHRRLGFALRRQIKRRHKARRLARIANRFGHHLDRKNMPVFSAVTPRRLAQRFRARQPFAQTRNIARRMHIQGVQLQKFVARVAVVFYRRVIDRDQRILIRVVKKYPHRQRRCFKQRGIALLAFQHRLLCLLALGDVLHHADPADGRASFIKLLPANLVNPAYIAGRRDEAVFDIEIRSFAHGVFTALLKAGLVVRMHHLQVRTEMTIKATRRQPEQLADLIGQINLLGRQIKLTVTDAAHALRVNQFALGALAFDQLAFKLGFALCQRVGHAVDAIGNIGKFASPAQPLQANASAELPLTHAPGGLQNFCRRLHNHPATQNPGECGTEKGHARQRQKFNIALTVRQRDDLRAFHADDHKKR